jgi:hypothetical protein
VRLPILNLVAGGIQENWGNAMDGARRGEISESRFQQNISRKIGKVEFWEQFEPYFIS